MITHYIKGNSIIIILSSLGVKPLELTLRFQRYYHCSDASRIQRKLNAIIFFIFKALAGLYFYLFLTRIQKTSQGENITRRKKKDLILVYKTNFFDTATR